MATRGLTFAIGAVDKFSAPFRRFNEFVEKSTSGLRQLRNSLGNLKHEAGINKVLWAGRGVASGIGAAGAGAAQVAARFGALGAAAGFAFKTQFVDTAAGFEQFETILTTLNQGDTEAARKEMDWISRFAAKTPYDLAGVTDAFVKLRSYGLDPTKGLLTTLGDTASSMGKPLQQAVEAIADAVTGENERLKEFGITARKTGDNIIYQYTDAAGRERKLMAKASDRAAIQASLMSIWNEKFAGGMDRMSRTFTGLTSNLFDTWTRFTNMVMANGVFDWMKGKLEGWLDQLDELDKNGTLQQWAKSLGASITGFFEQAWEAGKNFWAFIQKVGNGLSWLADAMGGWDNMALAAVAVMSGPLIAALVQLGAAFITLGTAMLTTPFGWVIAVGVAFYAVIKNWKSIVEWLKSAASWFKDEMPELWQNPKAVVTRAAGSFDLADGYGAAELAEWEERKGRAQLGAAAVKRQLNEKRSETVTRTESTVKVRVAAPAGTTITQSGAPVDVWHEADAGLAMGGF
ncbi:tape measure protein [Oleidesulfovibrio alaskensis]|jgi:hypothetical protein|uniref:tape measure protein n=1 Tax=Oleidesulfovibrio alaskensis TaxID=58180 RepID=UPI001A3A75BA|nr:tape measure protein [Oleidesulfovibrio alaskensis]MBL3582630.1 hypothetical protein [Oleidesulfovibrio alaskensis]